MTILRAGPLQIDRQDERAWLQGEPVKLSPKAFGLLSALIAMPGRVVTKSELIETVWEGRAVSDAVLTTAMRELRRALNDNARSPSIIETVHGRGYRFLLEVKSGEVSEGPSAGLGAISDAPTDRSAIGDTAMFSAAAATFILLLAVAILRPFGAPAASSLTETPVKSVAVIPFDDLSGSDEHAWFAGGLTEEILSTLAKTPDLNVISTVALNRSVSAPQVARSRNAAHALTGSVRRASGRVRVTAQLTRAEDGMVVWSDSYDRAEADMIGIQEEIAFAIAQALRSVLDPETLRKMVETGTRSVEAYEALLTGHYLLNQQYLTGDASFRRRAYESYEKARATDPTFSAAHWLAARYWMERATYIIPPGEEAEYSVQEISEWFLERVDAAIATETDGVARQKYIAARHEHRLEFRAAHERLKAYVEARPNDPYAWVQLAGTSAVVGDFETGRMAALRLDELSERNALYLSRATVVHLWVRDFDGSLAQAKRSLSQAPGNAFVRYHAHRAFLWAGEIDAARELVGPIDAGALSAHNRLLVQLRQSCAERDYEAARSTYDALSATSNASRASLWLGAVLMGEHDTARSLLAGLDTPQGLNQLAAFTKYPQFASAEFDQLEQKFLTEGIERAGPIFPPYACFQPSE